MKRETETFETHCFVWPYHAEKAIALMFEDEYKEWTALEGKSPTEASKARASNLSLKHKKY